MLFHSSIMTSQSCWMLDTWCFSTFRLRMPHMPHKTYLTTTSPSAARQLSSWRCVWGGYVGKRFMKGGNHLLLQNVTVHVGIHVSLNEPQLPSTSSSHAAPDHDATTTMLDCRQGTIFLALLTRASPHMLDTIWVKQVYLRLIRPQDMVPVIHALGQVVFSKLFTGILVSQLKKRLPSGMTAMQTVLLQCVAYGQTSWPSTSATSKAMLAALMQLLHLTQRLNFFDLPLRGLFWVKPVLENLCMNLACTVSQFQAVTELLIA